MLYKMLYILLFMNYISWIECAAHRSGQKSYSPCEITSPFTSAHVSAYLKEQIPTSGCVTNATVPETGAELHAINLLGDGATSNGKLPSEVELEVKFPGDLAFSRPMVVVLNSPGPVRWRVKVDVLGHERYKNLFVVSRGSKIRFVHTRHKDSKPVVERHGDIPNNTLRFWSWLLNKYKAVTSLTELDQGAVVSLRVGLDSNATSTTCTSASDWSTSGARAIATTLQQQKVNGCLVAERKDLLSRLAYVVELEKARGESPVEVDLEISVESRKMVEKEFWLVLKSPIDVAWRVHTRKIQGYIDIVANSQVDMSGIRMHTVGVRTEEINDSGQDLLQWVEYYIGPVALYTAVPLANKIKITMPQTENSRPPPTPVHPVMPIPDPRVVSAFAEPSHTKASLRRVIRTDCGHGRMTVSIDKLKLQMFGVAKSQVTLLEGCQGRENMTHIYITTNAADCGTKIIGNRYLNALVIHSNKVTYDLLESGSGFGDDEFSGFGANSVSDVYMDDEDLHSQIIQIDFECEVKTDDSSNRGTKEQPKKHLIPPNMSTDVQFTLDLFRSILYMSIYQRFPVEVQHVSSPIYLQAAVTSDPYLKAELQSCWLSPHDEFDAEKYTLLDNKCIVDSTVKEHRISHGFLGSQSQRISFTLENYMKQSPHRMVYLKCQMSVCCIEQNCGTNSFPRCSVPALHQCVHSHQVYWGHSQQDVPSRVVIVGPLLTPLIGAYQSSTAGNVPSTDTQEQSDNPVIIKGLDLTTVVGIAFAAFTIGVLMMGALWFIHTHTVFSSRPFKRSYGNNGSTENGDYGETTPGSSAPISS